MIMPKSNFCKKIKDALAEMDGITLIRCSTGQGHLRFTIDFTCTNNDTINNIRDIITPFDWECIENNIDTLSSSKWLSNTPFLLHSKSKGETACFEAGTIAVRLKAYTLAS